MKYILQSVKNEIIPSKESQEHLDKVCREIINKVNNSARQARLDAELIIGGSVAKNTWLPGIHDIDTFLLFNYKKFKTKSRELSKYAEKILQDTFEEIKRLHGSRDYFQTKFEEYDIEIIPVLKISKPSEMVNITDVSPLHVKWVAKKTRKNKQLANEIRVAKKFFKAAKIYGAESFIKGFSGHVIEVLIITFGSFEKFLKAVRNWNKEQIVDPENYYKNKNELMKKMNASKLVSPLIVVDPVQPERNAAAALDISNFNKLIKQAKDFTRRPNLKFFIEDKVTLEDLRRRRKEKKLIVLLVKPEYEKLDVAGAKIMRKFGKLLKYMIANDFKIHDAGFEWDRESEMMLWFFTDKQDLPAIRKQIGPRKKEGKEFINSFKQKYGRRVQADARRYYVELPRKYKTAEHLVSDIIKDKEYDSFRILEVR